MHLRVDASAPSSNFGAVPLDTPAGGGGAARAVARVAEVENVADEWSASDAHTAAMLEQLSSLIGGASRGVRRGTRVLWLWLVHSALSFGVL